MINQLARKLLDKELIASLHNKHLRESLSKVAEQSLFKLYIHWLILGIAYGLYLAIGSKIDGPAPRMLQTISSQIGPEKFLLFMIPCFIHELLRKFGLLRKLNEWFRKQIFDFIILVCGKGPIGVTGFLLGVAIATSYSNEFNKFSFQLFHASISLTTVIVAALAWAVFSLNRDNSWFRVLNVFTILAFSIILLSQYIVGQTALSVATLIILLPALHMFLNFIPSSEEINEESV